MRKVFRALIKKPWPDNARRTSCAEYPPKLKSMNNIDLRRWFFALATVEDIQFVKFPVLYGRVKDRPSCATEPNRQVVKSQSSIYIKSLDMFCVFKDGYSKMDLWRYSFRIIKTFKEPLKAAFKSSLARLFFKVDLKRQAFADDGFGDDRLVLESNLSRFISQTKPFVSVDILLISALWKYSYSTPHDSVGF